MKNIFILFSLVLCLLLLSGCSTFDSITDPYDLEKCEKYEGEQKRGCYVQTCNELQEDEEDTPYCLAKVAKETKDDSYCWEVRDYNPSYAQYVGMCYGVVFTSYVDCVHELENSTMVDYCILADVEYNPSRKRCDSITGDVEKGICYAFLALGEPDIKICDELSPDNKELGTCYGVYSTETGKDYCTLIEDIEGNSYTWCLAMTVFFG
ncbi:MAG: hypothetical protein ABIJ18_05585 [archaeon]